LKNENENFLKLSIYTSPTNHIMNEIAKVSQPSADVRPPENAQETKPTQYKATKIVK